MNVKVISNKANRDITVNKLYPVLIKKEKEDLNEDELIELITSEAYSIYEKNIFIEVAENKINDNSAKILAKYFQNNKNIELEMLLPICKLLSKYQNQIA